MLHGKKIVVVMPAFNAELTLVKTVGEVDRDIVDEIILVDDGSSDGTVNLARKMGLWVICHEKNKGYGANQKTCYEAALATGADVVVMLHPDYQYTPRLLVSMAAMIAYGQYDAVLASRILGRGALKGGMPLYKYFGNRVLTLLENIIVHHKLSEYHTGYRAFSQELLWKVYPALKYNSDDFVFDNQMIVQMHYGKFRLGEISCPTIYQPESSSISFTRSIVYGLGVLKTAVQYRLQTWGIRRYAFLTAVGDHLADERSPLVYHLERTAQR